MNYTIYHNYADSFDEREHEKVKAFKVLYPHMRMKARVLVKRDGQGKETHHYKTISTLGIHTCSLLNYPNDLDEVYLADHTERIILLPN